MCWGLVSGCLESSGDGATLMGVEIGLTVGCLRGVISVPRAALFGTVATAAEVLPYSYSKLWYILRKSGFEIKSRDIFVADTAIEI